MYSTALYIHLLAVTGAFLCMGMMLNSMILVRAASRVSEAARFASVTAAASKIMPIATLLLLVTGGYMAQDRWSWSASWVDLSIAGLLIVTAFGAGVMGSRERGLHKALAGAASETLDGALEAQVRSPFLIAGSGLNAGLVCAVMYVMVAKPDWGGGIIALLLGAIAGYGVFSMAARRASGRYRLAALS